MFQFPGAEGIVTMSVLHPAWGTAHLLEQKGRAGDHHTEGTPRERTTFIAREALMNSDLSGRRLKGPHRFC